MTIYNETASSANSGGETKTSDREPATVPAWHAQLAANQRRERLDKELVDMGWNESTSLRCIPHVVDLLVVRAGDMRAQLTMQIAIAEAVLEAEDRDRESARRALGHVREVIEGALSREEAFARWDELFEGLEARSVGAEIALGVLFQAGDDEPRETGAGNVSYWLQQHLGIKDTEEYLRSLLLNVLAVAVEALPGPTRCGDHRPT